MAKLGLLFEGVDETSSTSEWRDRMRRVRVRVQVGQRPSERKGIHVNRNSDAIRSSSSE